MIDRLTVLFLKFLEYFHKLQVFMWWILELHIIKIVSSYIIWVSVKEASDPLLYLQPGRTPVGQHFPFLAVHDFVVSVIPTTLERQGSKMAYTLGHTENQMAIALRCGEDHRAERGSWLNS